MERVGSRRGYYSAFDLQSRTTRTNAIPMPVPLSRATGSRGTFGKNDGDIEVIAGEEPHLFKRAVFSFTSRTLFLITIIIIGVHHVHVTVARLRARARPRPRARVKGLGKDSHIGQVSREESAELLGLETTTASHAGVRVNRAEGVLCEWVLEVGVGGRGDGP